MAECIYSNSINKSILTSGFTIPVESEGVSSVRRPLNAVNYRGAAYGNGR